MLQILTFNKTVKAIIKRRRRNDHKKTDYQGGRRLCQ